MSEQNGRGENKQYIINKLYDILRGDKCSGKRESSARKGLFGITRGTVCIVEVILGQRLDRGEVQRAGEKGSGKGQG